MAGQPNARLQLAEVRAENEKLKAELERFHQAGHRPARRQRKRTYDASVIDDLFAWSDEGEFVDEMLAKWGIDESEWEQWQADHVELREAVRPARALARGHLLKMLRQAMATRTAFPTALADRILARIDAEGRAGQDDASALIVLAVPAADPQSAGNAAQPIEVAGRCPTCGRSDAPHK